MWSAWTAPSSGTATVTTSGSPFDTLLGVYTGSSVSALTLVKDNDDVASTDGTSAVTFAATAGTTYRIVVDGYNGTSSGQATGSIALKWSLSVPVGAPANDNFASAVALSGSSGSTSGTNVAATKETGEPSIAGNSGGASVWYRWTSPTSGTATVTTSSSSFDTLLGVYTGTSVSALTLVKDSDDVSGTDRTSAVTFPATAGTTYRIAVDGYRGPTSGQATGSIALKWSLSAPVPTPANDNFSNAQSLSGSSGSANGTERRCDEGNGRVFNRGQLGWRVRLVPLDSAVRRHGDLDNVWLVD